MKKMISITLVFCLVLGLSSFAKGYDCGAYILMDRQTRAVLSGHNIHEKLEMASTTKIMTAIVAIELGKLDEYFTIPKEAAGIEGSSIYLSEGETFKVIDLLYGLMIRSGNDSAIALAIHTAGSESHFIHLMNRKAEMIGAHNTSFANPHGLDGSPDKHYTTAYDLALITAYAMDNPIFRQIASSKYYRSTTKEGTVREFHSNNRFILNYPHASASKTGWTTPAGRCLSAVGTKDFMEFVAVFLDAPDWFDNAMDVIDWGFENHKPVPLLAKDTVLEVIDVENGEFSKLPIISKEEVFYPVKTTENPSITSEITTYQVKAPVNRGQKVGEITFYDEGEQIYTADLIAGASINTKPLPMYKKWFKSFFSLWRGSFSVIRGW